MKQRTTNVNELSVLGVAVLRVRLKYSHV